MMGYLIPRLEQTGWPYCSQTLSANPWWQQPPENSIRYSYDAQGNLRTSVDANGNTIEHWYDHFGKKSKSDDPDMGQWTYQYDSSGKLISQTNANGQQAVVEYDALGRMIGRIAVDGETNWLYVLFDNSLSYSVPN